MREAHLSKGRVISVRISPKDSHDWQNLLSALSALCREDPVMSFTSDEAEHCTVVAGMNELHLQIICDRLERQFSVPLHVGELQVIYRETIRIPSEGEGKHIRQVGGFGHYAHVRLSLDPAERGSGFEFRNQSAEKAIPHRFIESIESGIREAMKSGVLSGNEVVDIRVILRDGSYHVQDSSELAFKTAAACAFTDAASKASPFMLEPVMSVKVFTPQDFAGSIMADLNSRRGRLNSIEAHADAAVIRATVPLRELLGYPAQLRALSRGTSSSDIQFAGYEPIPEDDAHGLGEDRVPAIKPPDPSRRRGFAAVNPDELVD
jgi:elongation factor G